MKIAILGNAQYPFTDSSAFGVQAHIYTLSKALIDKGHEVDVYASGESSVSFPVISVRGKSTLDDAEVEKQFVKQYDFWLYQKAYLENKYDIYHSHDPVASLLFGAFSKTPTVATVHDPWSPEKYPIPLMRDLSSQNTRHHLVAISKYQHDLIARDGIVRSTVQHHGIDISSFVPPAEANQQTLLFLSRLNPRKGGDIAIRACIDTGKKLVFSGFAFHSYEKEYKEKDIDPLVRNQETITMLEPGQKNKHELFADARAFLFPIQWEEPFGLVMIEAMATGTPVIAFARGSVPEIVRDGITGFIVNPSDTDIRGNWIVKKTGLEGFREAIERLYSLPEHDYSMMRNAARALVEEQFTTEKMIERYEALYLQVHSNI